MQDKIMSLIFILGGLIILLFRKYWVQLILKCQCKSKPSILKFFERKVKQEVDWDTERERRGYPLVAISTIIAGIFFISVGLLTFFGIWHFRP